MSSEVLSLPKINFSGLVPGSTGWDTVQDEMMEALKIYGCFDAVYDKITPELRETLFDRAIPEAFNLPLEVKKGDGNFQLYAGPTPGQNRERLGISDDIEQSTRLLWAQGNPTFSDTVSAYMKHLKELEQMIVLMICRSLGIEKFYESHLKGTVYGIQLFEYGLPLDQETKVALGAHLDPNFISILCQHRVEGLQVQTKQGEWINVVPAHNSVTVLIGEALQALFNGRLSATVHRVIMTGKQIRHSVFFTSASTNEYLIQAPKELVDEEHPLLYKPYKLNEYIKFHYSDIGSRNHMEDLETFCGVNREEVRS